MKIPNGLLRILQIAAIGVSIAAVNDALAGEETDPKSESEQIAQTPSPEPSPTATPYDRNSCIACGMG